MNPEGVVVSTQDDPVQRAWEKLQAIMNAHEEMVKANHALVDVVRELRGFAPIDWGE